MRSIDRLTRTKAICRRFIGWFENPALTFAWNMLGRDPTYTAEFDFESALVQIDARQEYGETRYVALGNLRGRLNVLCFTETADGIRVISFRKANDREVRNYAKVQTTD